MKLINVMKYEIRFKTIQSYFQLNEHIFCNSSSSSILLLTYNLQIPLPTSVQSECPWVKSWDQISFFHYKSVLSSFSSVPVLAKKQLFSGPNEYHIFYLYMLFTSTSPPVMWYITFFKHTNRFNPSLWVFSISFLTSLFFYLPSLSWS